MFFRLRLLLYVHVDENSSTRMGEAMAILVALLAVILTTMLFTALMQTIEADANLQVR